MTAVQEINKNVLKSKENSLCTENTLWCGQKVVYLQTNHFESHEK